MEKKYISILLKGINNEVYRAYKKLTKYKLATRNKELFEEALKKEVDRLVKAENAEK